MTFNLTKLVLMARDLNVNIYLVPDECKESKNKQGIHLLQPVTEYQLLDALNVAERDGFTSIYLHNQF